MFSNKTKTASVSLGNGSAKKAYNAALKAAQGATATALALREGIVASNPGYKGPSVGHLQNAVAALGEARTFTV